MWELVIYVLVTYNGWELRYKEVRQAFQSYEQCVVQADAVNQDSRISDVAVCLANRDRRRPSRQGISL